MLEYVENTECDIEDAINIIKMRDVKPIASQFTMNPATDMLEESSKNMACVVIFCYMKLETGSWLNNETNDFFILI
jgi:hypothetical protein